MDQILKNCFFFVDAVKPYTPVTASLKVGEEEEVGRKIYIFIKVRRSYRNEEMLLILIQRFIVCFFAKHYYLIY